MIHPWAGTQVPSVPWRGGGGSLPPARERVCGRVSVCVAMHVFVWISRCLCANVCVNLFDCVCPCVGLLSLRFEMSVWCVLLKYHPFSHVTVHLLQPRKKVAPLS